MADRYFKQFQHTLETGLVTLYGKVVTSTSGTVSTTSCVGFSVAKTGGETGRYTVTLSDYYYGGLKNCSVMLVGAADAAYTTGAGMCPFLRNVSVSGSAKTFDIQFCSPDGSPADAEVEDAASFYIEIVLKNSSLAV